MSVSPQHNEGQSRIGDAHELTKRFDRAVAHLDRELAEIRISLVADIEQLGRTVAIARNEVVRLRSDGGEKARNPIPDAADELDAIVHHTAQATETILEASEVLDALADRLPVDEGCEVRAQTIRIFEACSFQDITGQRIGKVVAALKTVENQVAVLVTSWGVSTEVSERNRDPLLNGPQRQGVAIEQDAIDSLMEG